jgi:uncharacterized protein
MVNRTFQDFELPQLGFGAMRLPVLEGTEGQIDEPQVAQMVAYAMEHGVNYFDTAWAYHGGESENVMGRVLKAYPRDSFYLASKFPGYDLANMGKTQEIFEKQLQKCQVEYFDFYLIHNVCELNIDAYLDRSYGTYEYLMEQKRAGRIRHLGFSAHGSVEVMERFLDEYGADMEFCQIQLNYLDYDFQDARGKLELLRRHNIPAWIMEPLRGGRLANLDEAETARLAALRPQESAVGMAFRFVQSLPGIVVTLSGMSDFDQLKANIATFETDEPLNGHEMDEVLSLAHDMTAKTSVPCTACRYCTDHCPQGLDIPTLLAHYNEYNFTNGGFLPMFAVKALDEDKRPSACLGCGACAAVCPQAIDIPAALADFTEKLGF